MADKKSDPKKAPAKKVAPAKETPAKKTEAPKKSAPAKRTEAPKKSAPAKRTEAPKKSAPAKRTEAPKKSAPAKKTEAPAKKTEAPVKKSEAPAKKKTESEAPAKKKTAPKKVEYDGPTSDIKVNVYSIEGKKKGKINLPKAFDSEIRMDLIRNAVTRARANRRQPYGPATRSGFRHSVETWGKGRGAARVQRVTGEKRGAQSPGTVGGRKAHPPKPEKDWSQKMNTKERRMARMSALSATKVEEMVRARGHRFDEGITLPLVIEESFERMTDDHEEGFCKAMIEVLENIGVYDDVTRASEGRHVRAGRGKMRGRRFRTPKSLLVVVEDIEGMRPLFRNMPGVEVVSLSGMSTERLAPGGDPGRLTLISMQALERMMGW